MQIKVENLTYVYSEKAKDLAVKALDDVSLLIEEGDFFGVIGKTGSGKSTFIQHLNGLIKIGKDKGKILIGEYDLSQKDCDFNGLRAKLGMVFQYPEYQLFAETVFDDVAFGLRNFYKDLSDSEIIERVKSALETVGLDYEKYKDRSPFELSGGQKRRVAIAGVIVTRPEVLVLDEPLAGLDPKGKRELTDLLKRLHASFVKTVVIVSHDMDFVAENCNKIAVFLDGKIVKTGTPKQVFSDQYEMEELGLEMPLTAYLTQELKKKNLYLDSDLTVKDFCKEYALKKGGNN